LRGGRSKGEKWTHRSKGRIKRRKSLANPSTIFQGGKSSAADMARAKFGDDQERPLKKKTSLSKKRGKEFQRRERRNTGINQTNTLIVTHNSLRSRTTKIVGSEERRILTPSCGSRREISR